MKEILASDDTQIQIARTVMSYKRFLFITRCLRFDDKNTREERRKVDKLAAIHDLFQAFVNNCKSSFNLGEYTTIDQMLHPFRGRCGFIQYIPNKPAKDGIKMFALCDAKSFYTSNLEIYCGKRPDGPFAVHQFSNWYCKASSRFDRKLKPEFDHRQLIHKRTTRRLFAHEKNNGFKNIKKKTKSKSQKNFCRTKIEK